jgi:hypothetical protein
MEMRREALILVFIMAIPIPSISVTYAVDTFYCGPPPSVIPLNVTIWWPMGPDLEEADVENLHKLADQGVKINYRLWWWEELVADYPGGAPDIYYNETFRKEVERVIDDQLDLVDTEKLWAITLSEEEPMNALYWYSGYYDELPEALVRYSDNYYAETGFQLKPFHEANETEGIIFLEWLNEKTVWSFNHLYDYVKSEWPHLKVFQFVAMAPISTHYDLCAPYELKADGYFMDFYLYEANDNPWLLYECIRRYKTTFPDKEFHIVLWGTQPWPWEGWAGGFEHIRRNAWIAYLDGADVVGWFTYNADFGWGPHRKDGLGIQLYMYTNSLCRELAKLPVLKPEPQVLGVGGEFTNLFGGGYFGALDIFAEYDAVNQRFFAKSDMDLSKYKLIVISEWKYYEETVRKLNDYVEEGGNVIFLGGMGFPYNVYANETRRNRLLIEENAVQGGTQLGHIRIDISKPNMLGMDLDYDGQFHETYVLEIGELNENYHPIGDFYLIEEDTSTRRIDPPLVLYHNKSNPRSGWILYGGAFRSSRTPGVTSENYEEYQVTENYRDMKFLYKEVFRAFANFLNITGSISTTETENIIITQSKLEDETVLAGVSNLNLENRNLTYSLDLSHLGLPDGEYWVHSLDENAIVGQFESEDSSLVFTVDVGVNGTRLYLISQQKPAPHYSIEIFPEIPERPFDIYQLTNLFLIIGLIAILAAVIVIILKRRRKKLPSS